MKQFLLFLLCLLPACGVPETTVTPLLTPPETQVVFLPQPQECVGVVELAAIMDVPTLATKPIMKRANPPMRAQTPQQIVASAQQYARVTPEARGYFGGSAEYTYVWQPGKVYVVLLSPKSPTVIILPPGEKMVAAMYVDKDAYEVTTTRAGHDLTAYDTITVRPVNDKGEVDSFILTESGRRYLFHFLTGTTGMQAVTFEASHVAEGSAAPQGLVLPKPAP